VRARLARRPRAPSGYSLEIDTAHIGAIESQEDAGKLVQRGRIERKAEAYVVGTLRS
jgi:hypothetical protein